MADDPYRILGVDPGAPVDEVRRARRRLAKLLHPDIGTGDAAAMAAVNRAYERIVGERSAERGAEAVFTLDVLPVEAFHVLEPAVAERGEVLAADEPYRLEAYLAEPTPCFCTLELVPEAGGTIVTVVVEPAEGVEPPTAAAVVAALLS